MADPKKAVAAKPAPAKAMNPFAKAMQERKEKEEREAEEKRKKLEEARKNRKPMFAPSSDI